jgi:Flp pilus assembly pilin Flp
MGLRKGAGLKKEATMAKLLRSLARREEGQAMTEYSVLFPGAILIVITVAVIIGPALQDAYCSIVGPFNPTACTVEAAAAPDEEPTEPEITPTATPQPCVELQAEQGCSQCDHSPDCLCLPGVNDGSYSASRPIQSLVIKAARNYFIYQTGYTDDGCYHVTLDGYTASWVKVASGPTCQNISHLESWYVLICEN